MDRGTLRMGWLASVLAVGVGCRDQGGGSPEGTDTGVSELPPGLLVLTTPELRPTIEEFVRLMPDASIAVAEDPDPWAASASADRVAIAVRLGEACVECYRLASEGPRFEVAAGDVLGAQYGLAHVLEAMDVRFFAPGQTHVPEHWPTAAEGLGFTNDLHEPEIAERGVQLHTLHTIEAFYAFWVPSEANLEQARVIADWYVKQRANFVQWVGLDNVIVTPAERGPWREHTATLNAYLHERGVRTGLGVQLYGASNLQQAFDLAGEEGPDAITERLTIALEGTGFDHVTLSFGEFSAGTTADEFVAAIDDTYAILQELAPGTTMSSVVHVGNYPDLLLTYEGEEYLYYLLAQFADPNIVPWVHTVMYYNLYDDAGGAYLHDEFVEHRELLHQRLRDGEDVAYFPETAYWIAFDNSVPTYLPIYMKSRFIDLERTRQAVSAPLERHIDFSSGFEWGFWQNDYAFFRMSYALPATWNAIVEEMFEPFGAEGATLASIVVELGEIQYAALIGQRLAPYLAGRDGLIDVGAMGGVIAAPDRIALESIAAMTAAERDAFAQDVVAPLFELADATAELALQLQDVVSAEPWRFEIYNGIQVTALRARFVANVYLAVLEHAQSGDSATPLADARDILDTAAIVVDTRHANVSNVLVGAGENATIYPYGYLLMADTLCYWNRELVQATNIVERETTNVPACFVIP